MPFKLRKVSHPDLNHFHRNIASISGWLFQLLIILGSCPLLNANPRPQAHAAIAGTQPPNRMEMPSVSGNCLYEPVHDAVILKALDFLYQMDYGAAESTLTSLPDIPARTYFRGIVLVNRFNDLGDTSALFRAERMWEAFSQSLHSGQKSDSANWLQKCTGSCQSIYVGLTNLQLSYVANSTRRPLRAALLSRKAVRELGPFADNAEAAASLALFDYYKATLLKNVDWLPFVQPDQAGPISRLEESAQRSRYLKEILQTTLLWLYYDRGRYDSGLKIIDAFLTRYPQNRLYRQIKADFLYRKGDLSSARTLQENLQQEYLSMEKSQNNADFVPIGYLSSTGNLIKIYSSQNESKLLADQVQIWHAPRFRGIMNWLPTSLKEEVAMIKE